LVPCFSNQAPNGDRGDSNFNKIRIELSAFAFLKFRNYYV